jgi:hypothetical protein
MSVENLKVVDFASIDKNGCAVLTISDHLEWDKNNEHLLILQNKINAYLNAIEGESFYIDYPDAKGRTIIISIVAKYEPNADANAFLSKTKDLLQSAGYYLEFKVLKGE